MTVTAGSAFLATVALRGAGHSSRGGSGDGSPCPGRPVQARRRPARGPGGTRGHRSPAEPSVRSFLGPFDPVGTVSVARGVNS
jgi:hypothetical protein